MKPLIFSALAGLGLFVFLKLRAAMSLMYTIKKTDLTQAGARLTIDVFNPSAVSVAIDAFNGELSNQGKKVAQISIPGGFDVGPGQFAEVQVYISNLTGNVFSILQMQSMEVAGKIKIPIGLTIPIKTKLPY
jgi:hypothetical protein